MTITESIERTLGPRVFLSTLGLTMLLLANQPVAAQVADLSGPTQTGQVCMQTVYGTPVANSNRLNCTANDIRLARALKESLNPTSCVEGSTFDLTATFEVNVTANSRYDAGFFFRLDGGDNARGDGTTASGRCSLSALDPALENPGLNLDSDTCGDLNSGTYFATFTIPGVQCVGVPDPENPGKKILKLPNCTSWHSNQGTACTIDDEQFSLANAFDFHPDTKSKCVCDDDFTVPVIVETAQLNVVKTATPNSVPEPGGEVTYTVQVENQSSFVSVTITSIIDVPYGNLGTNNPSQTDNTCVSLIGVVLGPGESTDCSFKAMVSGNFGDKITDVVEVCGDQPGIPTPTQVCGDDFADVMITDLPAIPALAKTAQSAACTVDVTYQVVVSNNSVADDTLTVHSLTDDKFGDITTPHVAGEGFEEVVSTSCGTGGMIAKGNNYTCSFVGRIDTGTGPCDINHVDVVTGAVTDDDGKSYTPSDSAQVNVNTVLDPLPTP